MYCEIKILNDFRKSGMDPDNHGETENNRDSVAKASVKLVIWMHNNPKFSS